MYRADAQEDLVAGATQKSQSQLFMMFTFRIFGRDGRRSGVAGRVEEQSGNENRSVRISHEVKVCLMAFDAQAVEWRFRWVG